MEIVSQDFRLYCNTIWPITSKWLSNFILLKIYFGANLRFYVIFKSVTSHLCTSCFLLNYLKVKIKQQIVIEMCESSFCLSTALNYFLLHSSRKIFQKLKIRLRWPWPCFFLWVFCQSIVTANENDSVVYISKARKQLTELKTLWAVESSDTRIFNKLRPITDS